jgi:hypothetical protein
MTLEEKIAEIISDAFRHEVLPCFCCKEDTNCQRTLEKCINFRLQALIAADRAGLVEALTKISATSNDINARIIADKVLEVK